MSPASHTFLFADLAGFTALTEAHGDERAADVAVAFCSRLNELLPADAEDLKMLGDACLVRVGDAGAAVRLGVSLVGEPGHGEGGLDVRVGMNSGPAVQRGDDWFGATVNVEARVAELAGSREVLLTEATRSRAGDRPGFTFEDRGTQDLRNVSAPVRIFRAVPAGARGEIGLIDPVCRMRVPPGTEAVVLAHEGTDYSFCSKRCAETFSRKPGFYV